MTNILLLSEDHQILGRGYCSGYLDIYQKFNTGFYCPEPMVLCCGLPTYKYCCTTKESLIAEKNNELDLQTTINNSRAPIALAIISGITLLSIFIFFASCYFCSCCLVYKKRQTQLSRGLYRIQQGTTSSFGNYCSPSSLNSSVTTPLDNDLIHLIHQLPTPTSSSSTNNLNRISNNSFSPCNFTPNNFGGGQNQFSQYLRNSQSNLPRFVPPPTPPPYYIFNESRRPLSYPRYNNYSYSSLQRDPTLRQFYSPYPNANANANALNSLYNNYAYHRNIDSILQPSLTNNNYIPNLNSYNYPTGQHINMRNRPTPPPPPPRSSYYQPVSNINQSRSISSNNNSSSNSSSGYGSGQVRTISQVISIINSFVAEESRRLRENNERNARSSNTNNNGHGETTNGSQSPSNTISTETGQTGANDNDSNNYPVAVEDSGNETSCDGRSMFEKEMNNLETNDQVISLPLPPAPSELEEISISGRPDVEIEIDEIIDESDGEMETEFSGESHEESHEETIPVICSDPDQEIKDQNEFNLANEQKQNTTEQQCVC